MQKIGEGFYGKIYSKEIHGQSWAIKVSKDNVDVLGIPEDWIRDVEVLKNCDHTNVMKARDVSIDHLNGKFSIEMPLGICDLRLLVETYSFSGRRVLKGIARGLHYLEEHDILHGDLKPDNIIIFVSRDGEPVFDAKIRESEDGKYHPMISDFGLSYQEVGSSLEESEMTAIPYKAPEELLYLIIRHGHRDFKTITWVFACIMYYVLTGNELFEGIRLFYEMTTVLGTATVLGISTSTMYNILSNSSGLRGKGNTTYANRSVHLDGELEDDLFGKCLKWDPEDRLTITEICNHPYFGMNLEKIPSYREKLKANEYDTATPSDYSRFLGYLDAILSSIENDNKYRVVPLAVEIFKRSGRKARYITTAACLLLAAKVKYIYFDMNTGVDQEDMAREEALIMEGCDYKLLTTTRLSYLDTNNIGVMKQLTDDILSSR